MPTTKPSGARSLGTPTSDVPVDERGLAGRIVRSNRARYGALVTVAYSFLAFALYWNAWTSDPTKRMPWGGGDTTLTAWFLTWSPFAVFNAHNLFFTNWINFPLGINVMQNTGMPLLALLAAPVTATFGPIASVNLLLTLSFAATAGTGYLLVRRWTTWRPAAFIGGLLIGFSPFMVAQGGAHLHMVFVPLIPLIFLVLDEILVRQRGHAALWGLALAALVVAQFFVATEPLADTAVFALIGVAVLAAFNPSLARAHFRYAALAFIVTAAAAGMVLAYPIWAALAGPQHYTGPPQGAFTYLYRADLFGFLSPTPRQLIHPRALSLASDTAGGFPFEVGTYLGIPLIVVVCAFTYAWRRIRVVTFAAVMLVIAYILSLGSQLTVGKDPTDIPLPGGLLFDHVPLLDNALAVRFSFFASICAAVILGVGLDRLYVGAHGSARWRSVGMPIAIAFLALLPLVPAHAYAVKEIHQPAFFSSPSVDSIPGGSVAVIYPFPRPATPQGMLWQAQADMRFKMAGAYALVPAPVTGEATLDQPSFSSLAFRRIYEGKTVQRTPALRRQLRSEWRSWRVQTVIAARAAAHSAEAQSFIRWVLNRRPTRTQGVAVWRGVTSEGA